MVTAYDDVHNVTNTFDLVVGIFCIFYTKVYKCS